MTIEHAHCAEQTGASNLIDWFKHGRDQVEACRSNTNLTPEQAALIEIVWPTLLEGRFPEGLAIAELAQAGFPAVDGDASRQRETLKTLQTRWQQLAQPRGER